MEPAAARREAGARASALSEAAGLLARLVEEDVRTICFLKSRRGVELIQKFTKLRLEDAGRPDLAERIAPYRAGYTPQQRREIERRLAEGDLLAVVATERARAGHRRRRPRRGDLRDVPGHGRVAAPDVGPRRPARHGLAMYVAGDDALDQFFCRHPDEFLDRAVESAILDHENEEIHLPHLMAAAYELPLTPRTTPQYLGPRWRAYAEQLVREGGLREKDGRFLPRGEGFPAGEISLRSAGIDSIAVVEAVGGEMIGNVEPARAPYAVHPGAVYLHMGQSYEVEELDLQNAARWSSLLRRLVHAAEEGDRHLDRGDPLRARVHGRDAELRDRRGHRAGGRLPEEARGRPRGARPADGRPARAELLHAGALVHVPDRPGARRTSRCRSCRARCTRPSTRRSPCCR